MKSLGMGNGSHGVTEASQQVVTPAAPKQSDTTVPPSDGSNGSQGGVYSFLTQNPLRAGGSPPPTRAPSPPRAGTPSPGRSGTPSPGRSGTPSPGRSPTPGSGRPITPSALRAASPVGVGNASPGANGNGTAAVITVAELETMLSGLRSSLASIQESRAQYVKLLAQRDATITDLHVQLSTLEKKSEDLDRQLRATQGQLKTQKVATDRAQTDKAAAEERAQSLEKELAQVREQMAAQQEAWAQQQQVLSKQVKDLQDAAGQSKAAAPQAAAAAPPRPPQQQQQQPPLQQAPQQQQIAQPPQQQAQQQQPQQAVPAQKVPPAAPPAFKIVNEVTIQYRTGWRQCYLHCNIDGKGWTNVPGIKFEPSGDDLKVVKVQGTRLEFVITNGQGDWDGPGPDRNYQIQGPGTYTLQNGQIKRDKARQSRLQLQLHAADRKPGPVLAAASKLGPGCLEGDMLCQHSWKS
eukprot:CAMPEP_0202870174 /NCGR_PEP_ID=MMETSP1391-20130828/14846_1 /ASSEMBLY_ACC=CAM_ASM_000867 /TAXON_ID=1034604 /ORGANISM="Chlamydomonas leiostraca, Strain SAG 11-49" /LENGTH=462 /DNA_ID=CAMNT_0049550671 /DNA_START=264 /DNA_END=1653 /DNA_ORIENTATION=+